MIRAMNEADSAAYSGLLISVKSEVTGASNVGVAGGQRSASSSGKAITQVKIILPLSLPVAVRLLA